MTDELYLIRVRRIGDMADYWLTEPVANGDTLKFVPTTDRQAAAEFSHSTALAFAAACGDSGEYRFVPIAAFTVNPRGDLKT